MTSIIDKFRLAKLVNLEDGKIDLMGLTVSMTPVDILVDLERALIEDLGYEKAYETLYEGAKEGSKKYNEKFMAKYGFKDRRKILEWQVKIVTSAGWGVLEISKLDFEKKEWQVHMKKAPFPKQYGHFNYPVDIIPTGFIAGGLC